jgi:hypothetical protein
MKYLQYTFTILSLIVLFIFLPSITQAREVSRDFKVNFDFSNSSGFTESICKSSVCKDGKKDGDRQFKYGWSDIRSTNNKFWIDPNEYKGEIEAKVKQEINLVKNNNNMNSSFDMKVDETTSMKLGSMTGVWRIKSGASSTYSMDGKEYTILRTGEIGEYNKKRITLKGAFSSPKNNKIPTLSSNRNDIISCNNNICTAKKEGSATITASFPTNSSTVNTRVWYQEAVRRRFCSAGYFLSCINSRGGYFYDLNIFLNAQKDITSNFSFKDIAWNVTVLGTPTPKPNQKPTVSLTRAIATSDTNVSLEWNYRDVENDPQAQYNIQISENNNFRTIKVDETTSNSNRRQDTVRDLDPGTIYYARIRVSDEYDPNRFSDWSNVRAFRTPASRPTSNQKPTVSLTRADSNSTNVTLGWEYKDKEENPQAKYIIQISKRANFRQIEVKEEKSSRDSREDTVSGLDPGTKYYARIRVSDKYDPNRFSVWSNVREFTTENKIIPPGPDPELETKSEISIQCSLDKTTVSSRSPTVNITGIKVEGITSYQWRVDRGDNTSSFQNSKIANTQTLDYTGVRFGGYSPFIEIRDKNRVITKKECGTLTNLGDSNIREVR